MSRRALSALATLVGILAAVVVLDRPAGNIAPAEGRVLPGISLAEVRRIELRRPADPPVIIARGLRAFVVDGHPASDQAIRDLVGALETLAWRRRVPSSRGAAADHRGADPRGLDSPRLVVELTDGSATRRVSFGRSEPALARAWANAGGEVDLLVDDYLVRALDRSAADLRSREPFSEGIDPQRIELAFRGRPAVALRGRPLCVQHDGACAAADPHRVTRFMDSLTDLRFSSFLEAPPSDEPEVRIALDDQWIAVHGACPPPGNDRAVSSAIGAGCVPELQLAPILAAPREDLAWVERRITTLSPAAIDRVVAGELVLERHGGSWRRGSEELSSEAVRDWLGALTSYDGLPQWSEMTAGSVAGEMVFSAGDRSERVVLLASSAPRGSIIPGTPTRVRRAGEPLLLTMHPSLRIVWQIDPVTLTDRRVIDVDPSLVAAIRIEDAGAPVEIVVRGETLERWRVTAPVAIDSDMDSLSAMRDGLARLTAGSVVAGSATPQQGLTPPRRRLTVILAAAPGEDGERRETVELGASSDGGCFARRADRPVIYVLRSSVCAVLEAHLATRTVFESDIGDLRAVSLAGRRLELHGSEWYDDAGRAVTEREAARLGALVRALSTAAVVEGYGPLTGAPLLSLETRTGKVELVRSGDLYARRDRRVRYRLSPEAVRLLQ